MGRDGKTGYLSFGGGVLGRCVGNPWMIGCMGYGAPVTQQRGQ